MQYVYKITVANTGIYIYHLLISSESGGPKYYLELWYNQLIHFK